MGGMCSSPENLTNEDIERMEQERHVSRMIDGQLGVQKKSELAVLKLLLLGTGESGKSTLFKQIVHLYRRDDNLDPAAYASIVYTNTIVGMKTLCQMSEEIDKTQPALGTKTAAEVRGSLNFILNEVRPDQKITEDTAEHIKRLWADQGIRNTYNQRSRFQLIESCRYFFSRIDEISVNKYVPSYQDILHCRARTTGIVETTFTIDDNKFMMVDVGGQRNERRKWIHCFDGVTAVIFVAAINEYDQVLYEDGQTNRVIEALDLFAEICNSRWFRDTAMILFLNKRDLFEEKLLEMQVDLATLFPKYTGGLDYTQAVNFLEIQFIEKNGVPDKKIYVHVTCATDTNNISFTFNAVKDIIIQDRLKECGLLE